MSHWPHSPCHHFNSAGTYMVTGSTLQKEHFFRTPADLDLLQQTLMDLATLYDWKLEAWAIFSNHYHFIAQSPNDPSTLRRFITHFHATTARELNKRQNQSGRKVWFQYWDTQLTYRRSYLARLNYVMKNPVKHQIVDRAENYPWCSEQWFNLHTDPAHRKTVASFKIDSVHVEDDF